MDYRHSQYFDDLTIAAQEVSFFFHGWATEVSGDDIARLKAGHRA